jgi:hypothetical protein
MIKPMGRGVLDTPPSRGMGMTARAVCAGIEHSSTIFMHDAPEFLR